MSDTKMFFVLASLGLTAYAVGHVKPVLAFALTMVLNAY